MKEDQPQFHSIIPESLQFCREKSFGVTRRVPHGKIHMCKKAYRLRAIFTIQTLALAVEVECWDQSPEGIPTARQNACGDGFFGWKEGKDVAQNRVRKITDPVHRCVCVYVFFGRDFQFHSLSLAF